MSSAYGVVTNCENGHRPVSDVSHVLSCPRAPCLAYLNLQSVNINHMFQQRLLLCIKFIPLSIHACSVQGVITVGDYDGVVSQIHLESGHFVADLDDHGGQRYALRPLPRSPVVPKCTWSIAHLHVVCIFSILVCSCCIVIAGTTATEFVYCSCVSRHAICHVLFLVCYQAHLTPLLCKGLC